MDNYERESIFQQRKFTEKEVSVSLIKGAGEAPKERPLPSSRHCRTPSFFHLHIDNTLQENGLNRQRKRYDSNLATKATKMASVGEHSRVQDNFETSTNSNEDYIAVKGKSDVSVLATVSVRNEDMTVHLPTTSTGTSCITQEQFRVLNSKGTMTHSDDLKFAKEIRSILEHRTNEVSPKTFTKCFIDKPYERESHINNNLNIMVEPPLEQKFSVIRVPTCKRSWTSPFITKKVGVQSCSSPDNDTRTYVCDDSSETDSLALRRNELMHRLFPIDLHGCISLLGAGCIFLSVAMMIYVVFGNEIIQYFFPQEEPEWFLTWCIKYLGSGFANLFIGFFRTLGKLLKLLNPEPEEPRNPFRWNKNW